MLNRIAVFNFLVSVLAVYLLRSRIKSLDMLLSRLPETVEIIGMKLSVGTPLLALLVAVLSRAIKLHDRLSDLFRIRRNFDIQEILIPMAQKTVGPVSDHLARQIERYREHLMGKVFYEFASSSPNRAVIDPHLIHNALDQWSWFWAFFEGVTILTSSCLVLFLAGAFTVALIILAGIVAGVILLIWMRSQCDKNAAAEIAAILASPERKDKITEVFRAL